MFWMINTAASAAGIEIKGTVTDSKGEPLPGVNIVELGVKKNNGTITDLNGKYTITVESQNLFFSTLLSVIKQQKSL